MHPDDIAALDRAECEVKAVGFDAGITRLDIGLEIVAARRFAIWTDGFALYWGFDGPPAHLAETSARNPLTVDYAAA